MPFEQTGFDGLLLFAPVVYNDDRGFFFESFNETTFRNAGIQPFVQDNQSFSKHGVIRGLHYQLAPYAQSKLVRVISGEILDVVVDIRKGSPTYGKIFNAVLSAENRKQLFIPKGFAHGFSVLSPTAEVLYKCDTFYNKESEAGILYNDATLNIDWQINAAAAIVSEKDILLPAFDTCRNNFVFAE
ncbi:MAG: dTDP-4-dehydrorhamnose 3,5-epimerase [Chitinophagaceae bacterium]|nr:dTDP-4-dehydrorhamnose 3,5-epimerase [Chitinophagaceae bacterium]